MDFFLNPERLLHLLWIIPLCVILWTAASLRRKKAIASILGSCHRTASGHDIGVNTRHGVRFMRTVFLIAALVLSCMAWARPAWGKLLLPQNGAGRDITVLLDVSKSMLASDVPPSRLGHAKALILSVAEMMGADRFSLISFAGAPFMECPLTVDRVSFAQIVNMVDETAIPVGGTDIEKALKLALEHFKGTQTGHRAVLLISDGEEQTGKISSTVQAFRDAQIPVLAVGVGDPVNGSVIQVSDGKGGKRFVTDAGGEVVKSRLEESGLREIARQTEGLYLRSDLRNPGEKEIVGALRKLTPAAFDGEMRLLPIERWPWFVGGAVFFLLLFMLLREGGKFRPLSVAFNTLNGGSASCVLLVMLALPLTAQESDSAPGKRFIPTAAAFYNEGVSLHQVKPAEAEEHYRAALDVPDAPEAVRTRANQNLGALFYEKGRILIEEASSVAQRDPDSALSILKHADAQLSNAGDYFKTALASPEAQADSLILNLNRQTVQQEASEALRKAIEAYKKQMQQTRQEAQKAQQEQQKAQKQPAGSPQKQQAQQEADKQTQAAQTSAQNARKSAESLKNEQLKQNAQEVEKELDKAREAQEKKQSAEAQKHLDNAVRKLQEILDKQKEKEDAQKESGDKQKSDNKEKSSGDDKPQDQPSQESQGQNGTPEEQEEKSGENKQPSAAKEEPGLKEGQTAEILLREMAKDEEKLREALKQKRFPARQPKIEKDW